MSGTSFARNEATSASRRLVISKDLAPGKPDPPQLLGHPLQPPGGHPGQEEPADGLVELHLAPPPPVDDLELVGALGEAGDPDHDLPPAGLEAAGVGPAPVAVPRRGALVGAGPQDLGPPGLQELLDEGLHELGDAVGDVVPEQPGQVGDELEGPPRLLLRHLLPCYLRHRAPPPVDRPDQRGVWCPSSRKSAITGTLPRASTRISSSSAGRVTGWCGSFTHEVSRRRDA